MIPTLAAAAIASTLALPPKPRPAPAPAPLAAAVPPGAIGPSGLPGGPVSVHVLENGLTIVLKPEHARPLVAVFAAVKGGSRTEPPELKGLSHYYEHIIFRGGTAKQKELETRQRFQVLGTFYGWTWNDETAYYVVAPKEKLDEALWRHADAVLNVQVTAEKVEKDRQSIVQELHMRVSDDPAGRAEYNLYRTAFTRHPYGVPTIGLEEVVSQAQLPLFKSFYEERYVPNQMVLTAVGDFEPDAMLKKLTELWGAAKPGKASFDLGLDEPEQTETREVVEARDVQLSRVHLGFKIPGWSDPIQPALDLVQAVAIDLADSRLNNALKLKRPIAVDLAGGSDVHKDPSLFVVNLGVKPGQEREATQLALAELARLAKDGPTAEELARAKDTVLSRLVASNEGYEDQAQTLARQVVESTLDTLARYADTVRRLTAEDVRRAAAQTFVSQRCTVSAVVPKGAKLTFVDLVKAAGLPAPDAPRPATPPRGKPEKQTVPGGLVLITQVDKTVPRATAVLATRGGLLTEEPGQAGVALLTARALERGTRNLTAAEFRSRLDELGAQLTGQDRAGADLATLIIDTPSPRLNEALALLMEAAFHPRLDAAELDKLKEQQLGDLRGLEDDSFALTDREYRAAVFGDAPYGRHVLGTPETVAKLGREAVAAFHKRVYVPANASLVVVGDLDPEAVRRRVTELAADLPVGPAPRLASPLPKTPPPPSQRSVPKDVRQVTFDLGRLAPGVDSPEFIALLVARKALGNLLFYRYVYGDGSTPGIAYVMWTMLPELVGNSTVYFHMGVAPENAGKARAGLLATTADLEARGLTDKELDDARTELVQQYVLSQQKNYDWALRIAADEARGLGIEATLSWPAKVRDVSLDDANAALRKYLAPKDLTLVTLAPPAK